ncbi:hypothetical protein C7S13_8695 [Burkholderia cepacia]|nr:hypothetical protein [Burkholderia cepacia]
MNQPSVLPGRKMRRSVQPARKQNQFSLPVSLFFRFDGQGKQLANGAFGFGSVATFGCPVRNVSSA